MRHRLRLTTTSDGHNLAWKGILRHMVRDISDSEKGNVLPPHRLLFPINSKCSFICTIPHTTAFVTPVVEHWLEREIAQWVIHMKDRSDDPSHHERTLLPRSYISLPPVIKESLDESIWSSILSGNYRCILVLVRGTYVIARHFNLLVYMDQSILHIPN